MDPSTMHVLAGALPLSYILSPACGFGMHANMWGPLRLKKMMVYWVSDKCVISKPHGPSGDKHGHRVEHIQPEFSSELPVFPLLLLQY
jgi:hypothetical protein